MSYEDNALRATKAAKEMIEALSTLDIKGLEISGDKINIGIGLHEGNAIVGNIGSSTNFDYTAIGDTVNLAARLESLTKHYQKEILVSEQIEKKISGEFKLGEIDNVKVKGKDIPTKIFSFDSDENVKADDYQEIYYKAYNMYKLGNFTTALEYFSSLHMFAPEDFIVKNLIDRCEKFIQQPPEKWDGSVALDFK